MTISYAIHGLSGKITSSKLVKTLDFSSFCLYRACFFDRFPLKYVHMSNT